MEVFLDQMWKFRTETPPFLSLIKSGLHKSYLMTVFLVGRSSKKTTWDCDTTLMLSFGNFLPTNFRRCDLPPCTPALGKDPPAMPRSLSRYLHSTGTLFKKKNIPLPMDRDRKEKVTMLDHDHQHDDGFQCSTTVWFFERCKSSISVFSFFGAWYAVFQRVVPATSFIFWSSCV